MKITSNSHSLVFQIEDLYRKIDTFQDNGYSLRGNSYAYYRTLNMISAKKSQLEQTLKELSLASAATYDSCRQKMERQLAELHLLVSGNQ